MTEASLIVPALGALYQALGPSAEALLRLTVGAAMVPHGLRMCLGYFKGTGGPVDSVPKVAERWGIAKVHDTPQRLIEDPDIEIIDLAFPPDQQPDLIRHALKQKHVKAILAQKPLAMNAKAVMMPVKIIARDVARFVKNAASTTVRASAASVPSSAPFKA